MDQEKFDQNLMDYLFDELDEVTSAAMKRKIDSDADCRDLTLGLRATLEVAHLPVEEPSADFEERILAAASLAQEGEPWSRKLLRSLSWAGSHAMRPQLAMAAMLVLVVGSSLLLLRVRTGAVAVTVTKEQGSVAAGPRAEPPPTPAMQQPQAEPPQAPAAKNRKSAAPNAAGSAATASPPAVAATSMPLSEEQLGIIDKQFDAAMASYNSGDHLSAQRQFAAVKASRSPRAGSAALYEARAVRAHSGCKSAVPYYNAVRAMSGSMSADATWEQADCHRILGEAAQARALYLALKNNKSYSARVAKELEGQSEIANSGGDGSSSRRRNATSQRPKNAAPPTSSTPAPQQQQSQPSTRPPTNE